MLRESEECCSPTRALAWVLARVLAEVHLTGVGSSWLPSILVLPHPSTYEECTRAGSPSAKCSLLSCLPPAQGTLTFCIPATVFLNSFQKGMAWKRRVLLLEGL